MLDVSKEDITEGSIPRALVALAAPLVAQNLVQVANAAADVFWLGRLGEDAVAAVGLNLPLLAVIAAPMIAVWVGTQVLVSQRTGADDDDAVGRAVFHGLTLAFVVSIVVTVAVQLGADSVVRLVGAGPSVAPLAASYLSTYFLLYPFAMMSDTLEYSFIGVGDSRAAMYLNFFAIAVNLVLDPVLIFGLGPAPELGVRGAALASILGYALAFFLAFWFTQGGRDSLSLGSDDVSLSVDEYREIVDVGLPMAGQRVASQTVRLAVVGIVAVVGGAAGLAAYTIGARIAGISFVPASGLQSAAQSVIGQNLGADRPDRAGRATWTGIAIATGALAVIGAVQWAVPGLLTRVFAPNVSPLGFDLTVEYLRVLAYGYWAIGATYLVLAGFNAARRTKTSLVVDLVKYWAIRFPIAVLALPAGYVVTVFGIGVSPGVGLGMSAIFWAVTGSNVLMALAAVGYYLYSTRSGMLHRAADTATASD